MTRCPQASGVFTGERQSRLLPFAGEAYLLHFGRRTEIDWHPSDKTTCTVVIQFWNIITANDVVLAIDHLPVRPRGWLPELR
jgi:hypothetical protein